MSDTRRHILLIEDNPGDARLIHEMFTEGLNGAYQVTWAETVAGGLAVLTESPVDVVLSDLSLPDSEGLDTFRAVYQRAPSVPIVVLSGSIDDEVAFAAVQAGAQDYLVKGKVDSYLLARSLNYAIERKRHEETQRFLGDASGLLATSLDLDTTIWTIARHAVPFLADCCIVDLVDENRRPRQSAIVHRDPAREEALRGYRHRYPLDVSAHRALANVLQTGQAAVYRDFADPTVVLTTSMGDQLAAERAFGFLSGIFVPLVARGRTLGAICLFSDEPGRHFDQTDLRVATDLGQRAALAIDNAQLYRQANDAIRLRDTVLSSVSHDLRNPLTAIRLIAETAALQLSQRASPTVDPVKDALGRIEANTHRMTTQVDELLDVARLQTGEKVRLTVRSTDLVALARDVIAEYQERTRRHRLRLDTLHERVVGRWDQARLERVLGNLLSNAIKYSLAGGDIVVRIEIEEQAAVKSAKLSVHDRGIGIPAADLPRVFSWFYRGENIADQVAGAGIGLAGARHIVELHGGSMRVESQEGIGSTFTVFLPLPS